jgi:lantibiotic biosynthesis protein
MTITMTWEILLQDEKAKPYKEKLSEITDALYKNIDKVDKNIGLMGGKMGLALYFFYYAKFMAEDKWADVAVDLISDIFDEINNDFTYHTHAGGLAGIGWSIELLAQNEFIDTDTNDVLEALDPYLHKAMIYDITNKNYDFLHGAVGNGTYFLSRMSNPASKDYISELVDHLEKNSETEEDGAVKWFSVLNRDDGTEGYNISLSHGSAAIIAFLGKCVEAGINKEKAEPLLAGAVQYLLKNRMDRTKFNSHFPSWIPKEQKAPLHPSRLAWCYGDLGISSALLHTARSVGNKEWEKIATEILVDSANRTDIQENAVVDAGLCHGAAGIMHIYNRAYHNTGIEKLKETTLYWAEKTLEFARFEDGMAGYKAWHTEKYGGWIAETGFLEGASGIGLGLISLVSDIVPGWDRGLYLS